MLLILRPKPKGLGVGRRGGSDEALDVNLGRTSSSADLGGSSKYSNENFED